MPRIRTIKPKFWDDTKLSKVSRDARLLFIGMWNFCDDLGVLIGDHTWIKSKIFPYDKLNENEFGNFLNELIEGKFVMCINSNKEEYIYIPKFNKHQRINKPNNDDIYIDYKELTAIINESHINHVSITEHDCINHVSSAGGKDRIGKDSKGKEEEVIFWESEKKSFLNSGDWIFNFCRSKDLKLEDFEKAAKEFLDDLELKDDLKETKELKRHFTNWYNLNLKNKRNGTKVSNGHTHNSKSAGAYELLASIKQDFGIDQ